MRIEIMDGMAWYAENTLDSNSTYLFGFLSLHFVLLGLLNDREHDFLVSPTASVYECMNACT